MSPIIIALIALAAVAVLAGVAFVVMGKGGELARFEADHPPLDLPADRPLSGFDVSRVLLPLSLWGYHVRAVDDVLRRVVGALSERDARIADLERRLAEAGRPVPPHPAPGADPGAAPSDSGTSADTGPAHVVRTGSHPHPSGPREPGATHRTGGAADGQESTADSASGSDAQEPDRRSGEKAASSGSSDDADDTSDSDGGPASARESAAAASQRPGAR